MVNDRSKVNPNYFINAYRPNRRSAWVVTPAGMYDYYYSGPTLLFDSNIENAIMYVSQDVAIWAMSVIQEYALTHLRGRHGLTTHEVFVYED